jgi:hypothetical protein
MQGIQGQTTYYFASFSKKTRVSSSVSGRIADCSSLTDYPERLSDQVRQEEMQKRKNN